MTNNDILRRIRYIKNFSDEEMIEIFGLIGTNVSKEEVSSWLKKDDHPDYVFIDDYNLATFLTGLIIKLRGMKDGGIPVVENKLTNNIILRKITIAFSLKSDDIINILKNVDFRLGKSELSAFFRNPEHKNYRECKSQVLRNFLLGLQKKP